VSVGENCGTCPTYAFQIPVDDSIAMKIAEPAGNPDQLGTRERRTRSPWVRPTSSKRLANG